MSNSLHASESTTSIQKRFFLLTFLILLGFSSQSQFLFNGNCQNAYRAIFSMRFSEASKILALEKKANPANRIPYCLDNYLDFMTLFIGEDQEQFRKLSRNECARLKILEDADENSPYYRFCIAQVRLQWAFVRLKFGEYITAVTEIRKASRLLEENRAKYPEFILNNAGLGVIHTLSGIVPDQYKWLSTLLGFEGSVSQGSAELKTLAGYDGKDEIVRLFRPEILFYLAFIEVNLNKDKSRALQVLKLSDQYAGGEENMHSPLMIFSRATILMRNGYNDSVISLLATRPVSADRYPILYLDYLMGLARLNRLDADADIYFLSFIRSFHGLNYIKSAYQKLAWFYLIRGNRQKYDEYIRMVLAQGSATLDEDRQAFAEARSGEVPSVTLLKARLLFDGGYYERAIHELLDKSLWESVRTKKDLVEYTYRMGRIYHETANYPKAVQYYSQTIRLGTGQPWYFAASAALQLGILNENSGNRKEAGKYYQMCLSMHYDEYKNSLSQKAKAGLRRVQSVAR